MLSRGQNGRDIMQMVWLEDLVPKDHLLRKIENSRKNGEIDVFISNDNRNTRVSIKI